MVENLEAIPRRTNYAGTLPASFWATLGKYWATKPSLTKVSIIFVKSISEEKVNLRVVAMIRAMIRDEVVSQLVAQNHPPVHERISSAVGWVTKQLLLVKLFEIEIVAE